MVRKEFQQKLKILRGLLIPFYSFQFVTKAFNYSIVTIPSVLFSSVTQSCLTLCDPMDCSTPGLPVRHQLPEFTQTHVHWVGDAIQPSHPLSSPSTSAFKLSQHDHYKCWPVINYCSVLHVISLMIGIPMGLFLLCLIFVCLVSLLFFAGWFLNGGHLFKILFVGILRPGIVITSGKKCERLGGQTLEVHSPRQPWFYYCLKSPVPADEKKHPRKAWHYCVMPIGGNRARGPFLEEGWFCKFPTLGAV